MHPDVESIAANDGLRPEALSTIIHGQFDRPRESPGPCPCSSPCPHLPTLNPEPELHACRIAQEHCVISCRHAFGPGRGAANRGTAAITDTGASRSCDNKARTHSIAVSAIRLLWGWNGASTQSILRGMPAYRYVRVDVFTDSPLSGNPLIVFTNASGLDAKTMQSIAREMNLSEAVFVLPAEKGGTAKIRIFTPKVELPFAGHPVLGAAFVLAAPLQTNVVSLETGQGIVPVTFEREGARPVMGWMQPPLPTFQDYSEVEPLLLGLGITQSRLPIAIYDIGVRHVFVAVDTPEQVHALKPDFMSLGRLGPVGFGPFAWDTEKVTLRVFIPGAGVNEDPATGSAAACLAVHLVRHGCYKSGSLVTIHQGERMGRASVIYARAGMNGNVLSEVAVGGCAVTVGRGELHIAHE